MRSPKTMSWAKRAQIHEAGHAVTAAYLSLPISLATIRPRRRIGAAAYVSLAPIRFIPVKKGKLKTELEIEAVIDKYRTKSALTILAARAAVESRQGNSSVPESDYSDDETDLERISRELRIPAFGLKTWREELFTEAKRIVSIPYVATAIDEVARYLYASAFFAKKGIPGKFVREVLNACVSQYELATTGTTSRQTKLSPAKTAALLDGDERIVARYVMAWFLGEIALFKPGTSITCSMARSRVLTITLTCGEREGATPFPKLPASHDVAWPIGGHFSCQNPF